MIGLSISYDKNVTIIWYVITMNSDNNNEL
jgi:hypothetical protein